ncbi:MAG: 16S rRNA (guanine(527)-N(7))-methyltransferase RsmG [Flavobacteriaceae bacterium]|nr:16S rRNA (guanine(527)-N(7))-methyltransferase RsmG [Flavobacteriaceae bacterium]
MDDVLNYFPNLNEIQIKKFKELQKLYTFWNSQINLISRKDMDFFYEHHVLHSLGISKIIQFNNNSRILDVGTGGGFPGVPLAILFPKVHFYLIDSIAKKINVVNSIKHDLELTNVNASQIRAEDFKEKVDFVVSRAVTKMDSFVPWVKNKISSKNNHIIKNGILYLKGGELKKELQNFPKAQCFELQDYFTNSFFKTKKVVYLPL